MQNIMHLFHGIVKMTIAKPIPIKTINTNYMYKWKNDIIWKKTLTILNTNNCIGIIAKLDITFIIFSGKNKKKMLSNLMKKKTTKTCCWKTILNFQFNNLHLHFH